MLAPLPPFHDLPAMAEPVTVVGDVHLSAQHPDTERRFLAWLAAQGERGGTLIVLGDLFDWWVGRGQEHSAEVQPLRAVLQRLAERGVRLCFQGGNRDFAFRGLPGVPIECWPDLVRTTWGGRRVLLTHGDLLVTADPSYLRLRRLLRWRLTGWSLRSLPYRWLEALARGLRRLSGRAVRQKQARMLDIDYGAARAWLDAAQADVLVAGHVHTGVHHRLAGEPAREILVLKDWDRCGGVVRFEQGRIRLVAAES